MKMTRIPWVIGLVMLVALVGCSNPELEKLTQLRAEMMEVHDEVMPRIGEIYTLKKDLQAQHKTMALDTLADSLALQGLQMVIRDLQAADSLMMDWMSELDMEAEHSQEMAAAIAYYEEEKKKIDAVREKMLQSIENGQSKLNKGE